MTSLSSGNDVLQSNEYLTGALVILEIGGNDLLGSTSPDRFEQDLAFQAVRKGDGRFITRA